MKILHVTPYFAPAWAYGGPPRSIHGLCHELVRRGHDVTVLTTDAYDERKRAAPPRERLDGIEVFRIPNFSNRLAWRRQLFLPKGTASFLRDRLPEFDLVHLNMYRTVQDLAVHHYASLFGVPYVFSARGSVQRIVRGLLMKAIFDVGYGKRLLQDASRCIASSQTERAQYEAMGVPRERIRTVFNGVDSQLYRDLPQDGTFSRRHGLEGQRLITYVGRLNARKGLEYLLRAFSDLAKADGNTALVLAGPDDGYRQRLERLARSLHLSDRVVFPGLLAGRDRLAVFVDSQVIVYPAKHEVFGLVPFEALACGRPVVVADDSGCGEIIREAEAGLVVPVEDVVRLAGAISAAMEDGPEVSRMVERGRRFVRERLSWDVIGPQVVGVYAEAIAAGHSETSVAS